MKISNKRELQKIVFNDSSDTDLKPSKSLKNVLKIYIPF